MTGILVFPNKLEVHQQAHLEKSLINWDGKGRFPIITGVGSAYHLKVDNNKILMVSGSMTEKEINSLRTKLKRQNFAVISGVEAFYVDCGFTE